MRKTFTFFSLALLVGVTGHAQTTNQPLTMPFGKVDMADLQMKECDFEKDANAMVLFDKDDTYFDDEFNVISEFHKRIKIFNDNGKDEANIRITYYGGSRAENITDLQIETINDNDGKPEITKIDKKLIYYQTIDKYRSAIVFTFPNVKAGSIVEYKYRLENVASYHISDWRFQERIPVRYSEIRTEIPEQLYFKTKTKVNQEYYINKTSSGNKNLGMGANALLVSTEIHLMALKNVPALKDEPYMRSRVDDQEGITFQLASIRPIGGFVRSIDTWAKVGGAIADDDDFGGQLKRKLSGEETIIAKAKSLKTDEEKIAYIFGEVKSRMKWNENDEWYTNDGTSKAWEKQTGNSAEINLALYHLLKQAGIDALPMIVSTRDNGQVNIAYPFLRQFNRAVAYVPVDSTTYYILDATNKYNLYNEIPENLLNSYGLYINKANDNYDLIFLRKEKAEKRAIVINAELLPDGKMNGKAEISSPGYYKSSDSEKYKTLGEEKYKKELAQNDNNFSISDLKMENLDVDSLPLIQRVDFKLTLTGGDGTYIYFNPNVFASLQSNPFLAENRLTDIDFGFNKGFLLTAAYKIPAGYKADAIPKNVTLVMPDNSIVFRRMAAEEEGVIHMAFNISHKKSVYFKENYPELREFYKKMIEMLNEQVVLKKI